MIDVLEPVIRRLKSAEARAQEQAAAISQLDHDTMARIQLHLKEMEVVELKAEIQKLEGIREYAGDYHGMWMHKCDECGRWCTNITNWKRSDQSSGDWCGYCDRALCFKCAPDHRPYYAWCGGSDCRGMQCEHSGCAVYGPRETNVHPFGNIRLCVEHGQGQCVGTSEQELCVLCDPPPPEEHMCVVCEEMALMNNDTYMIGPDGDWVGDPIGALAHLISYKCVNCECYYHNSADCVRSVGGDPGGGFYCGEDECAEAYADTQPCVECGLPPNAGDEYDNGHSCFSGTCDPCARCGKPECLRD